MTRTERQGFDNYLKPPTNTKKKLDVSENDRLFSTSSGTYQQVRKTTRLVRAHLSTLLELSVHDYLSFLLYFPLQSLNARAQHEAAYVSRK